MVLVLNGNWLLNIGVVKNESDPFGCDESTAELIVDVLGLHSKLH